MGSQTSRSNIDKKLISYNTRRDALLTMETGACGGNCWNRGGLVGDWEGGDKRLSHRLDAKTRSLLTY